MTLDLAILAFGMAGLPALGFTLWLAARWRRGARACRTGSGLTALADATHEPPAPPGRNVHNPHGPALVTKSWPCGCQQTWDPFGRRLRHLGVTCEQKPFWDHAEDQFRSTAP